MDSKPCKAAFPQHPGVRAGTLWWVQDLVPLSPSPRCRVSEGELRQAQEAVPPAARPRVFLLLTGFGSAGASRQPCRHPFCRLALPWPPPPREGWGDAARTGQHPSCPRQGWVQGAVLYCKTAQILCRAPSGVLRAVAWGRDAAARSGSPLAGVKVVRRRCWAWCNAW